MSLINISLTESSKIVIKFHFQIAYFQASASLHRRPQQVPERPHPHAAHQENGGGKTMQQLQISD